MDKFAKRVNLAMLEKAADRGPKHTGRDDRATTEQVLDPRTRMILFKLLNQGVIATINGCISTGKEANVYHAVTPEGEHRAVKIYKTSILVFKDRQRYVSGEYRWRQGYNKKNPRKMVKLWAEKEMRNLNRLHSAGLPSPKPHILRSHVLVMDFFGEDGWAAPRLKDAVKGFSHKRLSSAYHQVVTGMRVMYNTCKLVHADFSEYNLLWHDGTIIFIDVSQSVEADHPRASEFLRMDCTNITAFFTRSGLAVATPRELHDFIVRDDLTTPEAVEAHLEELSAVAAERGVLKGWDGEGGGQLEHDVWMAAHIPQSLHDVRDVEGDIAKLSAGGGADLLYKDLLAPSDSGAQADAAAAEALAPEVEGTAPPQPPAEAAPAPAPAVPALPTIPGLDPALLAMLPGMGGGLAAGGGGGAQAAAEWDGDSASEAGSDDSDQGEEEEDAGPAFVGKHATKAERKAHKAAVKAARAEKRAVKIKKSVKKRKERTTSGKKKR